MGSELTEHKIPVIKFSEGNLKPGSDTWVSATKQVRYGLEEYGCFEIVYENFPKEIHNSIFGAAIDLFDLPNETKTKQTTRRPGALGYIPPGPRAPLRESIVIDSPTNLEEAQYFTNIMWPQGNDSFRETVHSFSKRLAELYETTIRMVLENYGVDQNQDQGLFESFKESSFHLFRFFKYRARQANETDVGLNVHTDHSFITVLHQYDDQVKGLQVKTKDGQWIEVAPSSSSFIVIAGDALMAWSNDRIRACQHHVIITDENKVRYSIGLFIFIKGITMSVPVELVDDEHPLRYKPFDHFEYSHFFLSGGATKYASPIKAFCGI